MASKLEKMARQLNDAYQETFDKAFFDKFGVVVNTRFSIISMSLVTAREDGEPLTEEQNDWATAYSNGYGAALNMVRASVGS